MPWIIIIYYKAKGINMSNIRLLIILGFKRSLFNLRVKAIYIEIFNILNGFRLELKVKPKVFKN